MKSSLFREVRYDRESATGEIVYEDDEACTVIVYEPLRFEHGDVAGVRTEDVIDVLMLRLKALQELLPCLENERAIEHLQLALFSLEERTRRRRAQGVEGTSSAHRSDG